MAGYPKKNKRYVVTYCSYLTKVYQVSLESVKTWEEACKLKKIYEANGHTDVEIRPVYLTTIK